MNELKIFIEDNPLAAAFIALVVPVGFAFMTLHLIEYKEPSAFVPTGAQPGATEYDVYRADEYIGVER